MDSKTILGVKLTNGYNIEDAFECFIGGFSAILFVFLIRDTPGPFIIPVIAVFLAIMWGGIIYYGFKRSGMKNAFEHLVIDYLICILTATGLALLFGQMSLVHLTLSGILGGPPLIFGMMALLPAAAFDMYNIRNVFKKYYIKE